MCGLFGIMTFGGKQVDVNALHEATNTLRHRGPDDEGYLLAEMGSNHLVEFCGDDSQVKGGKVPHIREATGGNTTRGQAPLLQGNTTRGQAPLLQDNTTKGQAPLLQKEWNLAFGFRRLSILDLSPLGHQPMTDREGSIWAILNGEIYNYIEIREELKTLGYQFKSNSDTEVVIYSYIQWGAECFRRFNGMWAILIYDRRQQRLICSRDRFGVKPLYYFRENDTVIFASELKAILKYLTLAGYPRISINENIVYDYLLYTFADHSRETFVNNIRSFPASHYLEVNAKGELIFRRYFSLQINDATPRYNESRFMDYSNEFRDLLIDSVKLRLRTDVPIGSCLSGGLDSSSIVTIVNQLMVSEDKSGNIPLAPFKGGTIRRELIGEHQKTFSAVYEDKMIDESRFINEIIRDTNCDGHFIFPSSIMLREDINSFVYHLDEPFVSTSMFAQWNVMKLAKQNNVKVLLDGQGSDETTAGYPVYYTFFYVQLLKHLRLFSFAAELVRNMRVGAEMIRKGTAYYLRSRKKKPVEDAFEYFEPDFLGAYSSRNVLDYKTSSNLQVRLQEDIESFSLPMLLRYEDRNSMAFSIEARTPFLDYRLVEFLMQLPVVYKMRRGLTKWILREAMKGLVSDKVLQRRDKKGFPTPEKKWLTEIREDMIDTIKESRQFLNQYVDADKIANNFERILGNEKIKSHFLWRVYNLAKWKEVMEL
jgi:asparagine synthase (glutamine-hydrolysing)